MPVSLDEAHDPVEFNRVVADLPITSPLQSWAYGEARKALGHEPMRFFIRDAGRTVGAVQLIRKPLVPGVATLYAPRGPALESLHLLPHLARPFKDLAKRTDAYLRIEPPAPVAPATESVTTPQEKALDQRDIRPAYGRFRRSRTEQPEHTILIDTSRPEDEVFADLHKMARRNVRTAERRGVVVARDQQFEDFWTIFSATNERAELGSFPRAYYDALWREGNKYGSSVYLLLARSEGMALAGGFFLEHGGSTAYLYGGSVRDDRPPPEGQERRQEVKAPDAFYWGAITDAQAHGFHTLDLWGIPSVLDESKHSFGVFRMKLKFGTQRAWFPAYDLDLSPMARPLVAALKARRKVLNYRSRGTTDDIL